MLTPRPVDPPVCRSPEFWGTQGGSWGRSVRPGALLLFPSPFLSAHGHPLLPPRLCRSSTGSSDPSRSAWSQAGRVVFEQQSALGQGVVSVTAHEASFQERWAWDRASGGAGGAPGAAEQEWRVLRFNGVTRQSVAKVHVVRYLDEVALLLRL